MRTRIFQGLSVGGVLLLSATAYAAVQVDVGSVSVSAGTTTVAVDVTLSNSGDQVAATANDIIFDPNFGDLVGNTACKINPDIGPSAGTCVDDPTSGPCKTLNKATVTCPGPPSDPCPEGNDGKKRFRGIILSTANTTTIPDGKLYTCTFTLSGTASGHSDLLNVGASASDPSGAKLTTTGANGGIDIVVAPTATATATETETPLPTNTVPAPTATNTSPPTATKTNTAVPTVTNTRSASSNEDDGCQIGAGHSSNSGWLVMLPVAALFVLRRRSR